MPLSDLIKPLKMEAPPGADFDEYPTEADPSEDGIVTAGIALETSGTLLDRSVSGDMRFHDQFAGDVLLKDLSTATGVPMMVAQGGSNGTAGSGKWMEYFASVSSETSPFVVPSESTAIYVSVSVKLSTTVVFGLYSNGVLFDTVTITSDFKAAKELDETLAALTGISVMIESGICRDPVINLFIRIE